MVFFGISTHLGGAERSLLDYLRYHLSVDPKADILVILPKDQGPLIDELRALRISVEVLAMPNSFLKISRKSFASLVWFSLVGAPALALYGLRLTQRLRRLRPQLIHSTGIKCHILVCLLARWLPGPIVLHFRDILPKGALPRFFSAFANHPRISSIAVSRAVQESLKPLPSKLLYDGISETLFFPQASLHLKEQLGIAPQTPLIGWVGVITRWKGPREFILAADQVLKSFPNTHFVLVGDQIYDTVGEENLGQELKDLVAHLKRQDRIHFVGFSREPQRIFNSLDLFVHASIHPEPFGRVIVEAQLCGIPVLAAQAGGALEIISNENLGYLHRPGDVNDLAQKIQMYLKDSSKAEKARQGMEHARRTFSLVERYRELKTYLENQI